VPRRGSPQRQSRRMGHLCGSDWGGGEELRTELGLAGWRKGNWGGSSIAEESVEIGAVREGWGFWKGRNAGGVPTWRGAEGAVRCRNKKKFFFSPLYIGVALSSANQNPNSPISSSSIISDLAVWSALPHPHGRRALRRRRRLLAADGRLLPLHR
jgi:hypothetical protein